MDLKELLGEQYKDGMTVEEINEALAKVQMPKDNSAEIEKLKASISSANSEAKKYKDELKAKLSEEELKAKEDAEKWEKIMQERDALLKEKNISNNKAKFLENGFTAELAESSAKALVDGDFDTVFKNLGVHAQNLEKKFKADNIGKTPKPAGGGKDDPAVTKEQFDKMSYAERSALYEKNKELYETLVK